MNYRWIFVGSVVLAACSKSGPRPPNADEIPETVSLGQTGITSGFAIGKIHVSRNVDAMRIGKYPVTVARYAQCVAVGACTAPARRHGTCATLTDGNIRASDAAEACADVNQAQTYCAWQGGGLPTFDQWQLGARGPEAKRYSWGDASPDCTRHVGGSAVADPAACPELDPWLVGKHPAGASPSGMQDANLAPAELLASQEDAVFPACGSEAGCIVGGLVIGAIDWVAPAFTNDDNMDTFAFRCALEGAR